MNQYMDKNTIELVQGAVRKSIQNMVLAIITLSFGFLSIIGSFMLFSYSLNLNTTGLEVLLYFIGIMFLGLAGLALIIKGLVNSFKMYEVNE